MVVKPEQTNELTQSYFEAIVIVFLGKQIAVSLARTSSTKWLASVMTTLNTISLDDPNDDTKSIGAYEHPEYHNVMGELLRRWKLAA
jgi:hypothetical protein